MSRRTSHQQVRCLGQIEHEHLVGDCLTDGTGKFHLRLLELLRVQDRFHRDGRGFGVWHLDTHRTLTRHGGDDTDAEGGQRQGDIVLQVLHLLDADTLGQRDLVEGDRRTDGGLDTANFHTKST